MRFFSPPTAAPVIPPNIHLHTISPEAIGVPISALSLAAPVSQAQVANQAQFIPFSLARAVTVSRLFCVNGAAVAGNIDVGIYDSGAVRLASAGSTVQAGINSVQYFDIADVALQPGNYYLAIALDGIIGTVFTYNSSVQVFTMTGIVQQAAAFPLPAPAVFAANTISTLMLCGLSLRASP